MADDLGKVSQSRWLPIDMLRLSDDDKPHNHPAESSPTGMDAEPPRTCRNDLLTTTTIKATQVVPNRSGGPFSMPDHPPKTTLPPVDEVPAAHLAGKQLDDGWTVISIIERPKGATGSHFSIPYLVENKQGEKAFLKALNIARALTTKGNLADILSDFAEKFTFERDLLELCRTKNLRRIIKLLAHGEAIVKEAGVLSRVPYLIFELAEGDIHSYLDEKDGLDLAWLFRVMKHVSLGIEQLHSANTAHQDLKPSNVLTQRRGQEMKLGDLGRAERRWEPGPYSKHRVPGALSYAPPEQMYGAFDYSWEMRRAGDLYQLGSLLVQLLVGHNLQALLLSDLPESMHPQAWKDSFHEVLPYLHAAHANVLNKLRLRLQRKSLSEKLIADTVNAVQQLTDPNPNERGHPKDKVTSTPYSVRRYVSLFNLLSRSVQFETKVTA